MNTKDDVCVWTQCDNPEGTFGRMFRRSCMSGGIPIVPTGRLSINECPDCHRPIKVEFDISEPPAGWYRVAIRWGLGMRVIGEALMNDGEEFEFRPLWLQGEDDPYPGEWAMMPVVPFEPDGVPTWISSGDLTPRSNKKGARRID